ncbi:MAG: hypothetical protein ACP5UV_03025 [Thermoplasmata archaeon]
MKNNATIIPAEVAGRTVRNRSDFDDCSVLGFSMKAVTYDSDAFDINKGFYFFKSENPFRFMHPSMATDAKKADTGESIRNSEKGGCHAQS